jgi:hypothetical protein
MSTLAVGGCSLTKNKITPGVTKDPRGIPKTLVYFAKQQI